MSRQPNSLPPDKVSDTVPFLRKFVIPVIKFKNPLTGGEDSLDPKNTWDIRTAYAMLPYLVKAN